MKTKPIAIGAAIGLGVLFLITKTKSVFSPLIYNQKIRGNDVHGSGAYGASRGDKIHNGEDIIAQPGQAIKAP
ncbi:hypothetical protein, partial [Maribacter sp.]|uniref:hypothetical protein n=1 Tax=Maribacter sp. TaxID=1897614 RepID=UPI0025BF8CEA